MLIRVHPAFVLAALVVGCHRPTEVRGLYLSYQGQGTFFPCDDSRIAMDVPDSALAARYHAMAVGLAPLFVRLRGIKGHSGGPKGGGRYYLQVQQILEMRARASGECPNVAQPVAPMLPKS